MNLKLAFQRHAITDRIKEIIMS